MSPEGTEAEGFVIRFSSGLRAKLKYPSYVHLHKLVTGVNPRDLWRVFGADVLAGVESGIDYERVFKCPKAEAAELKASAPHNLERLLQNVPDEFDKWAHGVVDELYNAYVREVLAIKDRYRSVVCTDQGCQCGQKEFAQRVNSTVPVEWRSAMFMMHAGKPINGMVWKSLYPPPGTEMRTFREDDG